jgi:hypothetical protein
MSIPFSWVSEQSNGTVNKILLNGKEIAYKERRLRAKGE